MSIIISMNKIALFLNGEKPSLLPQLSHYASIYCVDGAYDYLMQNDIKPDVITGDFDSIKALPTDVKHIYTPNQNFTDFEKALKIIIQHGHKNVDVFAANGLEQDHFLGNMTTAFKYKMRLKVKFFDQRQSYYFISKKTTLNKVMGKTISLFPFPKAKKVNSTGLKYPLKNHALNMKENKIGTRNKAIEETITITYKKGNILLFIEN